MQGQVTGDAVERLGLRDGAGEAVEHVAAAGRVALVEPLVDDPDHDVVGHEAAGVHDLLGARAELGALLDRGTEHVAGRDVGHHVVTGQAHALGALARTLATEQNHAHPGRSPGRPHDFRKPS